jgi:hypothetical protein
MNYISYLLIFCLVSVSGCINKIPEDEIEHLTIVNNSQRNIGLDVSFQFPDTTLSVVSNRDCSEILPQTVCYAKTRHGWKSEIQRNDYGVIILFISDNDTIRKYGGDVWREQYLVLKRYELTEQDLEAMNWTITYPDILD